MSVYVAWLGVRAALRQARTQDWKEYIDSKIAIVEAKQSDYENSSKRELDQLKRDSEHKFYFLFNKFLK